MAEKKRISKKNACLEVCSALCCRYLAVDIKKPRSRWDIDDLKWRLQFEAVKVYILNKRWNLLIVSKCMYLKRDNKCSVYKKRPEVCREHSIKDCERYGNWYDTLIATPDELEDYLRGEKKYVKSKRIVKSKRN